MPSKSKTGKKVKTEAGKSTTGKARIQTPNGNPFGNLNAAATNRLADVLSQFVD